MDYCQLPDRKTQMTQKIQTKQKTKLHVAITHLRESGQIQPKGGKKRGKNVNDTYPLRHKSLTH